jgi:prophage regulatory protein
MSTERLLTLNQVMDKIGRKKTFIYAEINAGRFPAPVKLGRASSWVESEIDAWIERLKQDRAAA